MNVLLTVCAQCDKNDTKHSTELWHIILELTEECWPKRTEGDRSRPKLTEADMDRAGLKMTKWTEVDRSGRQRNEKRTEKD